MHRGIESGAADGGRAGAGLEVADGMKQAAAGSGMAGGLRPASARHFERGGRVLIAVPAVGTQRVAGGGWDKARANPPCRAQKARAGGVGPPEGAGKGAGAGDAVGVRWTRCRVSCSRGATLRLPPVSHLASSRSRSLLVSVSIWGRAARLEARRRDRQRRDAVVCTGRRARWRPPCDHSAVRACTLWVSAVSRSAARGVVAHVGGVSITALDSGGGGGGGGVLAAWGDASLV